MTFFADVTGFQKTCHICVNRGSIKLNRGSMKLHRGSVKLHRGSVKLHRGSIKLNRGSVKLNRGSDKVFSRAEKWARGLGQVLLGSDARRPGGVHISI